MFSNLLCEVSSSLCSFLIFSSVVALILTCERKLFSLLLLISVARIGLYYFVS